jgi:hypothetical protein
MELVFHSLGRMHPKLFLGVEIKLPANKQKISPQTRVMYRFSPCTVTF